MMQTPPVARLERVSLHYNKIVALRDITLDVPAGIIVGVIGPDGVGKSSLLSLISGARALQMGEVTVLGGDMREAQHRAQVCPRIAYMPQGLGKNLYPTLSVDENLWFFARLFGHDATEAKQRIEQLTQATGLHPFLNRPAGKLSGGMKQKLGLCCALIHDPDLLILDEPTTGVDPLSRALFWDLIARIRLQRPSMSVIVSTAYIEEAQRFDWLVAMDEGRLLDTGTPEELMTRTGSDTLEGAFIAMLPEDQRGNHHKVEIPPLDMDGENDIAIEAKNLTMRFGDFVAVDHVSFSIRRGEIFGFLGSNGCGKSTTMKMLTGLLPASDGQARLFGRALDPHDIASRRRVGYMSQGFSLYSELTVVQNLILHARLFHVPETEITARVQEMVQHFDLQDVQAMLPEQLPIGMRQRLSLAVAMVHKPELLILDEPTSGVDPIARDLLWQLMIKLAREDKVTIFISTHFMNEAERCDRISLMHAGKVLASGTPAGIVTERAAASLEDAFIGYLVEAGGGERPPDNPAATTAVSVTLESERSRGKGWMSRLKSGLTRTWSFTWREMLELHRDPVRSALAMFGSLLLMFVMGYGITMDVENLPYAVLDNDQTSLSQNYTLNLAGSRYFSERPPLSDYAELDRRMRNGDISLAIEIPPGFGRDLGRGHHAEIGAWVDGAMPQRAETIIGYAQGMHQHWLARQSIERTGTAPSAPASIETRYRYNPDVRSMPAMVPAVIPLLLLMLPAMLTALAVVREKELGSIINLYVTPATRSEFLIGKQLPYIALAMLNFLIMCLAAVTIFGVPMTGSFATITLAAFAFSICATGMGLVASTVTRSQVAAIFLAMLGTMLPAVQFAGLLNPVSSLEGGGRLIGELYPATYMFIISRGVFSKALHFGDLYQAFWPLLLAIPVIMLIAIGLLKKQES